ncbi:hypothetical protein U1Q18_000487 [Sarracenia purpurea var. burkii]
MAKLSEMGPSIYCSAWVLKERHGSLTMVLGNLTSELGRIWSVSTVGFLSLQFGTGPSMLGDDQVRLSSVLLSSNTYKIQLGGGDLLELNFRGANYLDSVSQLAAPAMAPSRVAGRLAHSSSGPGVFFQRDDQSRALRNSHSSSSSGNSSNSIPGAGRSNLGPVPGDASNTILNCVASSGQSIGTRH